MNQYASDDVVIAQLKKINNKNIKETKLKISVAGIPGEYIYDKSLGKFELQDISFDGIYVKIPQIIPQGENFDIRFSLKLGGQIIWANVIVQKIYETNVYLEFIDIPDLSRKKIEQFIDEVSEKNIHRLLATPEKKNHNY